MIAIHFGASWRIALRLEFTERKPSTYLEQSQCLDIVLNVRGEAVVDAGRNDEQIAGLNGKADPLVTWTLCER